MGTAQFVSAPDWPYTKAKTAVLLSAAAVIREQGPRAATLKNIAHRAGITEPAIFRHFDGVDGLFAGLFSVYESFYERILNAYSKETQDLEAYLRATRDSLDILASSGDFSYLVVFAEQVFSGYEELKAKCRELKGRDKAFAFSALESAQAKGELKAGVSIETVAYAAMGIIHMSTVHWIEGGFEFSLSESCERRLKDFFSLLVP